jgi:hypothetical protein
MKSMIAALAIVACMSACKTEKTSVSDPSSATMPKAECSGTCPEHPGCTGAQCDQKKACCQDKAKPQG